MFPYYDVIGWLIDQVNLQTRVIVNVQNIMMGSLRLKDVAKIYKMCMPNKYLNDDFLTKDKMSLQSTSIKWKVGGVWEGIVSLRLLIKMLYNSSKIPMGFFPLCYDNCMELLTHLSLN